MRRPKGTLESPIFLHVTKEGTVLVGTENYSLATVKNILVAEANVLKAKKSSPANATVIIRGDADALTGQVQQLVQICEDAKFENFALRAEEDID